jgi:hypothetical protein
MIKTNGRLQFLALQQQSNMNCFCFAIREIKIWTSASFVEFLKNLPITPRQIFYRHLTANRIQNFKCNCLYLQGYKINRDFAHGTFRYSYKPITEKL